MRSRKKLLLVVFGKMEKQLRDGTDVLRNQLLIFLFQKRKRLLNFLKLLNITPYCKFATSKSLKDSF